MVSLDKLLTECVQQNGSYLHIKAGRPPILRLQPSQLMEMAMPPSRRRKHGQFAIKL